MHIYIDESGVFIPAEKDSSISCVAALVVPEEIKEHLFKAFKEWKVRIDSSKKNQHGEIKGSKLDERDFSSFFEVLNNFDLIVETVCIELGATTEDRIFKHKNKISKSFSSSKTGQNLNLKFNKEVIKDLSNSLFTQGWILATLINKMLPIILSYYAQRLPAELGNFIWEIDAKDVSLTEYEKIMTYLICPLVQTLNINTPLEEKGILGEADYSAFSKFLLMPEDMSEEARSVLLNKGADGCFNISKILSAFKCEQSHLSLGIQMADIIVNCIRRAMVGNLQFEGWKYLSSLFIKRKDQTITILNYEPSKAQKIPLPCRKLVNYLQAHGKQMLVPDSFQVDFKKGYARWSYIEDITSSPHKVVTIEAF